MAHMAQGLGFRGILGIYFGNLNKITIMDW